MGLTFIAIVLLAAAWAALLLPDLRGRSLPNRRSNSIDSFSRQLSTIDRARPGQRPSAKVVPFPQRPGAPVAGRSPAAVRSRSRVRIRRQRVLFGLAGLAAVTFLAGVVITPVFFLVHLVVDVALGGFVWLLVERRNRLEMASAQQRVRQVERVDPRPFRRTASGG